MSGEPDLAGRDLAGCACGHRLGEHRLRTYHGRSECESGGCSCRKYDARAPRYPIRSDRNIVAYPSPKRLGGPE